MILRTTVSPMAMGKRRRHAKQASMWVATEDLPRSAAHPFYRRLNQILDQDDFDGYVEGLCQRFYADEVGRPGLPPGRYFRLLLIGYFKGLDARARHRVACGGFLGAPRVSRAGAARCAAGSFDDFANPAPDRSGNARSRLHLDLAAARGCRAGERQDDRHRRDDVGSERRAAQHRAA